MKRRARRPTKVIPGRFASVEPLARVQNKLEQAKFHLAKLEAEVQSPAVALIAVQSYLGGCLAAGRSIFLTLMDVMPRFQIVYNRWAATLTTGERKFLSDMRDERNDDVHQSISTLHQNQAITPGGVIPKATEYRLQLEPPIDVVSASKGFVALMEDLIEQFVTEL